MVDLGAGEHGYGQVMKALYHRAITGRGTRLDVSMLRSAVSWMLAPVMLAGSFGERVRRSGTRHAHFAPVSVYQTSDGYLYMAVGSDRQWAALVALPPFAALARPDYARNAGRIAAGEPLNREVGACLRALSTAEALESLRGAGIPVSPVQTMAEVLKDPLIAPGLVHVTDPRSGITLVLPAPPVESPIPLRFPPRLGEHNERVYGSVLGLGAAKRADLERRGII